MDWLLGPIGGSLDAIELRGVSGFGRHGNLPEERARGQVFTADVVLRLDTHEAAKSDALADTVDYAQVAQLVAKILTGEPVALIETVATKIADAILALGRVQVVDVTVHKPSAQVGVEVEDVSVTIRRAVNDAPATFVAPDSAMFEAVGEAERRAHARESAVHAREPAAHARRSGAHARLPGQPPLDSGEAAASTPGQDLELSDAVQLVGVGTRASQRRRGRGREAGPDSAVDWAPQEPVDAIVALGANLGEALGTLRSALDDLREEPGIEVAAVSPLARTAPVGRPDQPDFFNAVTHIKTTLSPRTLLHTLQGIEEKHGRQRTGRWAPRTLDLDLIAYDTLLADEDELTIPHPRAHERAFVLVPWSLMAPGAFLPGLGGGPVAALAKAAPDRGCIRWLAPDWDRPRAARIPPPLEQAAPAPLMVEPPVAAAADQPVSMDDAVPPVDAPLPLPLPAPLAARYASPPARPRGGPDAAAQRSATGQASQPGLVGGTSEPGAASGLGEPLGPSATGGPSGPSGPGGPSATSGPGEPLGPSATGGPGATGEPSEPGVAAVAAAGSGPSAGPELEPDRLSAGLPPSAAAPPPTGGEGIPAAVQPPDQQASAPSAALVEVEGDASAQPGPALGQPAAAAPPERPEGEALAGPAAEHPAALDSGPGAAPAAPPVWALPPLPGGPEAHEARPGRDGQGPARDNLPEPLPAARPPNPYATKIPGVPSFFAAARQANLASEGVVVESAGTAASDRGSTSSAFSSVASFEVYSASNEAPSMFGQLELAHVPSTARTSLRNEVEPPYPEPDRRAVFEPVMAAAGSEAMPERHPQALPPPAAPVAPPAFTPAAPSPAPVAPPAFTPAAPSPAPASPEPVAALPAGFPGVDPVAYPVAGPAALPPPSEAALAPPTAFAEPPAAALDERPQYRPIPGVRQRAVPPVAQLAAGPGFGPEGRAEAALDRGAPDAPLAADPQFLPPPLPGRAPLPVQPGEIAPVSLLDAPPPAVPGAVPGAAPGAVPGAAPVQPPPASGPYWANQLP